jgi:hypothetical protein
VTAGGSNRTVPGTDDWAAGPLFADNEGQRGRGGNLPFEGKVSFIRY